MAGSVAARGKCVLLALAAVVAGFPSVGADPSSVPNLFSGESLVKKTEERPARNPVLNFLLQNLASREEAGAESSPKDAALSHTLVFQDGRLLHGELISLGKNDVVWKRGDASVPMTFQRSEIRLVALSEAAMNPAGYQQSIQFEPGIQARTKATAKPSPATIKLPGSDWLYATVTSQDGETFELSLGGDSKFSVPRSSIEWMHFGIAPAPAFSLTNDGMALAGWLRSNLTGKVVMDHGWMSLPDTTWIGRSVSPPARFEVQFELDATDTNTTALWIQPFGPQPNCYGTGTVELGFSPGKIDRCIYINNMNHEKSDMPKEAGPDGVASFRVFYDGVDAKLIVLRNGQQVGDWKLKDDKAEVNRNANWQRNINGVCLSRDGGLRLRHFSVQPWDGAIPKPGDAERTQDSLAVGKEAPILGKLESLSEKELVFSGEKKVPGGGVFLQLHSHPKTMEGADVSLMFGGNGELGAADFEIREGRAKFRTSFAGAMDVPVSALNLIRMAPAKAESPASGALVFKNGDELPGTLLRAGTQAPLLWKTPNGQEVEFQPERISGVRFPPRLKPVESVGARVELRNGDSLRGTLAGFGPKELRLQHPLLGELGVSRERLWTLFPNPKTVIFDASSDPEPWVGLVQEEGNKKGGVKSPLRPDCVYLNGFFLMRTPGRGMDVMESQAGVRRSLKGLPEKFEVRCEVLEPGGQEPNINVHFTSENDQGNPSTLDLEFYYGQLRVYGWLNGRNNSHSFWKDVQIRENNGNYDPQSHTTIRAFVDNKLGTVDIYSNGVHRIKSGQVANERIPGIGGQLSISGSSNSAAPLVISHVWAGPWNGQLPEPGAAAAVSLANGDVAESLPVELRKGKLVLDASGVEIEVPLERVEAIGFGGQPASAVSPGRLRLAGGDSLSVESFKFEAGQLTAHSALLGDFKLAGDGVQELIFDAAPVHFPSVAEKKKKALAKDAEKPGAQIVIPGLN